MQFHLRTAIVGIAIVATLVAGALVEGRQAFGQIATGCSQSSAGDPPRRVFRCANGLILELEAAAAVGIQVDYRGPQGLSVDGGAVFVEATPGARFQIRTPHAIASVRGTTFLVDVDEGQTSVFVVEGRVSVSRRYLDASVVLGAGEGVDVRVGEPLEVKTWGRPRVVALLARFGR